MTAHPQFSSVSSAKARHDHHPEKLSSLLERLAGETGGRITVGQLASALEDRSFGAFLVVFALPNLIPLPPGATLILGLPMAIVAWQILIGYQKVWLPRALAEYSMDRAAFGGAVRKINPWLRRAERWVRPRNWPITSSFRERLFGLFVLVLALVCVMPIPFGNWPTAFAVAVLGVAHTERDGNCLVVGIFAGLVALVMAGIVVLAAGALITKIFGI